MTTLLLASTGGHLKELHHLRDRFDGAAGPYRWVTFDTPQSRSLLTGERVDFVPFVDSRDVVGLVRSLPAARRIAADPSLKAIVTTGAAVALPFVGLGRARGVACHYIESAARADGPSVTGKMLQNVPGVHLYTQHRRWAGGSWSYRGSVFDAFAAQPRGGAGRPSRIARMVVTVGTCHHDFGRLLRRLLAVIPPGVDVLWQTGTTDTTGLPIEAQEAIPEHRLIAAMREADVVVSHAGIGSAMTALELGKCPVLVPRRVGMSEQIDDHQTEIARELGARGLTVTVEADQVTFDDLLTAAGRRITRPAQTPTFALTGSGSETAVRFGSASKAA